MSAPHFLAGAPGARERLLLVGPEARHAIRSLRIRQGDELTSSDGAGALARCLVERVGRDEVEAVVVHRDVRERPRPEIAMLLAAPKGERLTWAVQKLAELGVDRIEVLETQRSVRRWSGERAERLPERLRAVALEAAKQSRARFLTRVEGPSPWDEALARAFSLGRVVVLWEQSTRALLPLVPPGDEPVALVVGPEGGIPEADARDAETRGALLASLGPTLLRTETAAVAGAAVALAAVGRLG